MARRVGVVVVSALLALALPVGNWLAPARAATAAPVPSGATRAAEAIGFSQLILSLSAGPLGGDLAVRFADGSGAVILAGKRTVALPRAPAGAMAPQWVPGTDWIVFAKAGAPGAGAGRKAEARYALIRAQGGAPTLLPACASASGVQVMAHAVAWLCAQDVYVLTLPAAGSVNVGAAAPHQIGATRWTPKPGQFAYTAAPVPHLAVSPGPSSNTVIWDFRTRQYDASVENGNAAPAFALKWAVRGVLAEADTAGVSLWLPGDTTPPPRFAAADLQAIQWLPDGRALLALDRANPGALPPVYSVDRLGTNGSLQQLLAGRLGYVLGFSPGGRWLWREEGVAAGVWTLGPAGAGSGPFHLKAVPIPAAARSVTVVVTPSPTGGAAGSIPWQWFEMTSPSDGWATDGARVYATGDAGAAWTDVTPASSLLGSDTWRVEPFGQTGAVALALAEGIGSQPAVDGIFVTSDAGATWSKVAGPFPHLSPYHVTALDAQRLWAWTAGSGPASARFRLASTADGGATWTRVDPQGLPSGFTPADIGFTSPSVGWATGYGGGADLAVTRDAGATWQPLTLPAPVHAGTFEPSTPSLPVCFPGGTCALVLPLAFATRTADVNETVVYVSSDGGTGWRPTTPIPSTATFGQVGVCLATASDWFAVYGGSLYATADAGRTWRQVRTGGADLSRLVTSEGDLQFVNAADGYVALADPASGAVGIWKTTDGGAVWTPDDPSAPPPAGADQAQVPLGQPLMANARTGWMDAPTGGLFRTLDGGRIWTEVSPPDLGTAGGAAVVAVSGASDAWVAIRYAGAPVKVWRTSDGGSTWRAATVQTPPGVTPLSMSFADARHGWLLTQRSACGPSSVRLYRTTSGGATWASVQTGHGTAAPPSFGATLRFVSDTTGFLLGSPILETNRRGSGWHAVALPVPAGAAEPTSGEYVRFFNPRPNAAGALAYPGVLEAGGVTYRTADGGRTWTAGQPFFFPSFPGSAGTSVSFADPLHGWMTDGTYLAATSDGGATWHLVNTRPDLASLYSDAGGIAGLDFVDAADGFATAGRLLRTTDGGATWRVVSAQFRFEAAAAHDMSAPLGAVCVG